MLRRFEDLLFFLTILFLPTQLGKHFWPDFAHIYSLKIDYLSPTLYFWDILVISLLVIWFLGKPRVNKLALNIFLFFLFTQALSLLGSSNIGAGLVRIEQYIIAGFFGIFLASTDFKSLSGKIYLPLSLGILGESLIAILQFLKGETLGLWILGERNFTLSTPGIAKFDFYGYEFLRPYATFPHPNALAAFMLISIVILSSFLCHSERLAKNLSTSLETGLTLPRKILRRELLRMTLLKVLVLVAGVVVFLTMSRTAILAGFIMLTISLRRRWIVVITIITIMLSPILFTRFSSLLTFDNLTLLRREELAGNAWQMFLKSPVFGVGLNNFIPAMASQLVSGPSRFLQPVHNIFLLALAETGIVGLVGFLMLMGIPILSSLRKQGSINNNLYRSRIKYGMTISWLIVIFLGMFDHYFLTLPQGYRIFFMVWGLSFAMLK